MKVKFVPQNVEFEIKPGESVMHLAQDNGLYIKSVCKGVPSCAECRVRVVEGDHNVMPPGSEELSLIGSGHFIDRRRLSCQLKCFGDVTIDMNEQLGKQNGTIIGRKKKAAQKDDRVEEAVARRSEVSDTGESEDPTEQRVAGTEPQPEGASAGPIENRGGPRPDRGPRAGGPGDRGPRENRGGPSGGGGPGGPGSGARENRGPRGGGDRDNRGPRASGGPNAGPRENTGPREGAGPRRSDGPRNVDGPRPPQQQAQGAQGPIEQGEGGEKRKRRRRRGKGGGGGGQGGAGPSGAQGGPTAGGPSASSGPSRPSQN